MQLQQLLTRVMVHAVIRWLFLLLAAIFFVMTVTVPMDLTYQGIFALILVLTALFLQRQQDRLFTLMLMILSMASSCRYLYWRITDTINVDSFLDLSFATGLLLAELYSWLILMLGYFQTIWPLDRKPVAMPPDSSQWPTLDVFIPTYNEPLKVLKPTVLAALALDWPQDKLKVYILDDGRRGEFRNFAEDVGVNYLHYISRPKNLNAKAGNINNALAQTHGEYVAIFDCDHVPTRSFLQVVMGWFLKDDKLGLVQTPHHFFSPDPFERNLSTFRKVPNEGELFYGLVQNGNDLWNAAFFCGSCAVLRRKALEEIGGMAVETLTEDAHTALRIQRLGYSTAYLSIPQAAGLATESLSAHIGQRMRWARGMAQILRLENPLFGRGLTIPQRICYFNAMLHFFYGLPRIVFLTAPLSYLFFEAHIIQASALMILIYALPHLILANLTNSRIQGKYRHSFWTEVYECVLAWYIFRPTLFAMINPHRGRFNVTAKGGLIDENYFDWSISKPYVFMVILNVIGILIGIGRLFYWNTFEISTVVLNLIWTVLNVIFLGAAISVSRETKQIRASHRVIMPMPCSLTSLNGKSIKAEVKDYSEGGLGIEVPIKFELPKNSPVKVTLFRGGQEFLFPAIVVRNHKQKLQLRFPNLTLQEEIDFVQCTFARADAWSDWSKDRSVDSPLKGLCEVLIFGLKGLWNMLGVIHPKKIFLQSVNPSVSKNNSLNQSSVASTVKNFSNRS